MASITEAIDDIKAGKIVIVVDDENRENEGDFICAAELITPELVNFMASKGRGLICVPVDAHTADRLGFHAMVPNADPDACDFAVSVDLRVGITTGISAADRAATIRQIVDANSVPLDFVRPGHVFPLRAKEGGVLRRAGHTEAATDLCALAGLQRAGVICEIMNDDGTMARLPELAIFAKEHSLKIISIADLIAYRQQEEPLVEKISQCHLPTVFGIFEMHVFREKITGKEHAALIRGDISKIKSPLVRVHSECLTGDVFRSMRCDCRPQMDAALNAIVDEGTGVFLRMAQEGRGIGLGEKIKAYALQDQGMDTVEANEHLGHAHDLRDYGVGAQILRMLGIHQMRLLTNNPRKIIGLEGFGLEVTDRVPIEVGQTEENAKYLQTKKDKLGHLLDG